MYLQAILRSFLIDYNGRIILPALPSQLCGHSDYLLGFCRKTDVLLPKPLSNQFR